jgi:hypothetical protein
MSSRAIEEPEARPIHDDFMDDDMRRLWRSMGPLPGDGRHSSPRRIPGRAALIGASPLAKRLDPVFGDRTRHESAAFRTHPPDGQTALSCRARLGVCDSASGLATLP